MPKFYRYLIYRFYTWRLDKKDDTPVATIIFSMAAIHFIQIAILLMILSKFFPSLVPVFKQRKIFVTFFYFTISLLLYFLIYNKEKWQYYIEEFKNESTQQRRTRGIFVWLFTFGSIFLFFILLPVLFWNYSL
ncbi:MAG: hypothetical protein ABI675_17470 [Chitinophagaceae bacterium]